jgi:hypothetical protein
MNNMPKRNEERRVFTVELNSGSDLKKLAVPNGVRCLLMEGTIGELKCAGFVENSVLELVGTTGLLRVDLSREDLARPARTHGRRAEQ